MSNLLLVGRYPCFGHEVMGWIIPIQLAGRRFICTKSAMAAGWGIIKLWCGLAVKSTKPARLSGFWLTEGEKGVTIG